MEPGQGDGVARLHLLALVYGIDHEFGGVIGADAIAGEGGIFRRDCFDRPADDELRIVTGLWRPLGLCPGSKGQEGKGHGKNSLHGLASDSLVPGSWCKVIHAGHSCSSPRSPLGQLNEKLLCE
jgi:hypothetical protein